MTQSRGGNRNDFSEVYGYIQANYVGPRDGGFLVPDTTSVIAVTAWNG